MGPQPRKGLGSRLAWNPGPTQGHSGAELKANQVEAATPCSFWGGSDFISPQSVGVTSETASILLCLFPGIREGIKKIKRNWGISEDAEEHCCFPCHVGSDTPRCTED